ncbi:DUF938 domain-containing protein [Candidatus Cyanaurora vandensis]|uniref:DUF938 domain-containing protein n=1 Tax=Candidatus Cyanaurora vandensis TaxID=2714958 RepID=UPI00257C85F6|nr:DUF938 domain-containing protein [Candidatus Cyanaurora vandensis]
MSPLPDQRLYAPATERNREAILQVLGEVLPKQGLVLEVASGTGQHSTYFAPRFPHLTWQPSDPAESSLASITSWQAYHPAPNLLPPLRLDACEPLLELDNCAAILCINMIHIAPWQATFGLLQLAQRLLLPGGILYLYGPFKETKPLAPSNVDFDYGLRLQDPAWGIRDLTEVIHSAQAQNLHHLTTIAMPANNLSVILEKGPAASPSIEDESY